MDNKKPISMKIFVSASGAIVSGNTTETHDISMSIDASYYMTGTVKYFLDKETTAYNSVLGELFQSSERTIQEQQDNADQQVMKKHGYKIFVRLWDHTVSATGKPKLTETVFDLAPSVSNGKILSDHVYLTHNGGKMIYKGRYFQREWYQVICPAPVYRGVLYFYDELGRYS